MKTGRCVTAGYGKRGARSERSAVKRQRSATFDTRSHATAPNFGSSGALGVGRDMVSMAIGRVELEAPCPVRVFVTAPIERDAGERSAREDDRGADVPGHRLPYETKWSLFHMT